MPPRRPFSYRHFIAANRSRFAGKDTGEENMATTSPISDPAAELIEQIIQKSGGVHKLKSPAGKVVGRAFNYDPAVIDSVVTYSSAERNLIVDQLRLALSQFYVHLERKKAIYGFDPVRALDLLLPRIEDLSNAEFHESIVQLIAKTRDRHLVFSSKVPFGVFAGLGLLIEQCWTAGGPQYVVTKIQQGLTPKHLREDALVTHWNGIPIEKYIRLNANITDGGNEAASLARSLAFLTERPLNKLGPPLEEWVDLRFSVNAVSYEERFAWRGLDATPSIDLDFTELQLFDLQLARRVRFAPQSFDEMPASADPVPFPAPVPPAELGEPRFLGPLIGGGYYGSVTTQHGTFGYMRLLSFEAGDADGLVDGFICALTKLRSNGLIIDIRGNAGGRISAGERLLQLFTPRRITPSRFQFRVTPGTRAMVRGSDDLCKWKKSVEEAFVTGEPYSQGYPSEGDDSDANKVGQRYFGRVVLITDALAYSTADMFAAGFIDHAIGPIICTDKNMAAAGGNMWKWGDVRAFNPDFYLDANFKTTLENKELSPEVRDEFNKNGTSLSAKAKVSFGPCEFGGLSWKITDGALSHVVRDLPWQSKSLCVYLAQGRLGVSTLPSGIDLGLTMLRCVRVGENEGKVLEDLGIKVDVPYQMTFRDITDKNQDLITRASLELHKMMAAVS
jgi:hypothetical protein